MEYNILFDQNPIFRTPSQDNTDSSSVNTMRDYLTGLAGLSEQYNAFQAMLGQAATMQQLQAASQSAAQQAALAQYIQVNVY